MRKKKQAAMFDIAGDAATRLEFLKRNPEFLADIRAYNDLPSSARRDLATRQKEADRLGGKWKWKLSIVLPITAPVHLKTVWAPIPVRIVKMNGPTLAEQLRAERRGQMFSQDELAGRFITLEIDTYATIENLLPLIEKTLRDVYKAKRVETRRRRPTEATMQLKIYDLAMAGDKFSAIARKVRRPVTTVKSAFHGATMKIFGEQRQRKEARLTGFTPEAHFAVCEICKTATTVAEMCSQARFYIDQDQVSQRPRTGFDTTGEFRRNS
jgi:hypothetical protein